MKKPTPKKPTPTPKKPTPKKPTPKKPTPKKPTPKKPTAKRAAPTKAAPKKARAVVRKGPPRGFLFSEWKPGHFSLFLVGPGHAWERVCDAVAPAALKKRFSLDCEGGMFSAGGTDRAALEELRSLLEPYLTDPEKRRVLHQAAVDEGNI